MDKLKNDFEVFRGSLESMHGGLYRYRSKAEMDQVFNRLQTSIDHPMTVLEYFRELSPAIGKIQCGHTGIIPPEPLRDTIFDKGKLLPINIYFREEKAFFIKSFTEETQPMAPGDEILSINGISIDSLINHSLTVHSVGDGWIKTGKINLLNRVFSHYFALYFDQPDEYELTYIDSTAEVKSHTVSALSIDEMVNLSPQKDRDSRNIDLRFLDDYTAVLRVQSFDNWTEGKKKVKFLNYLEKVFQKVDSAKVTNLIVDVRDNGGGDDEMGLGLFSYFHNEPIIEFNEIVFRTKKLHYAKYADNNRFRFWLAKAFNKYKKINDSTYHIINTTTKPHSPSNPQFTGNVILLINGRSFSTTADFAALMKSYGKAIIVGEETSGGYYGNTSGAAFTYTLPHSGIKIVVPLMTYWTNVKNDVPPGRGVIPEHQIVPSAKDIIEERDVQMDYALQLVQSLNDQGLNSTNEKF